RCVSSSAENIYPIAIGINSRVLLEKKFQYFGVEMVTFIFCVTKLLKVVSVKTEQVKRGR
ncbi:MAG: hypothetical protein J7J07_04605, partial [Syntrophobacterales bacterium]|nr:hypothetical protein [Syntrophobacterales bacterium]